MAKIINPLQERFRELRELLCVLCDSYDAGNEVVGLSIATAIRVLVHDTSASSSLLNLLEKKGGRYLNTSFPASGEEVQLTLVRRINVGVTDGKGGEAKYWPLCNERYFPSPEKSDLIEFDGWWEQDVFINLNHSLTRKDLILAVANKDGGAHVDKRVDERYDEFRKSLSGGSSLVGVDSGEVRGYDNIPTYPAVRQIAFELLESTPMLTVEQDDEG